MNAGHSSPASSDNRATPSTNSARWFHAPLLFALIVFSSACALSAYAYLDCKTQGPPIRADGYGYYAYLPSVFIDGDLSMKSPKEFRWTVVGNKPLPYEWDGIPVYGPTGKYLDKYTIGTALLESPFFLAAYISAPLFHYSGNGYSLPFQIAVQLSGISYLAAGAFFLFRYLLYCFRIGTALLSATAIVFATNAIHYGTYQAAYSHAYSFFLLSLLLLLTHCYRQAERSASRRISTLSASFGFLVGLIALTRVPNLISVLIPVSVVLEGYARDRNRVLLAEQFLWGILSFAITLSPQLAYWYAVTGHLLVNSYLGETFHWLDPQILPFLFSLRRGLFFWSPVVLLAVTGLPLLIRNNRWLGTAICLVLLLEIYVCASWWSWWYGSSFGSRPMVDMMPLLALPLACRIRWMEQRVACFAPIVAVSVLVLLNLFLMISVWRFYLPWDHVTIGDLARLPGRWL